MWGSSKIISFRAEEPAFGTMEIDTRENGKVLKCMERVLFFGQMETNT
jgi:hypothetical protein